MVVDHSSIIREVDVGAAFLSAFTKAIFVKEEGTGNYFPAPFFVLFIYDGFCLRRVVKRPVV